MTDTIEVDIALDAPDSSNVWYMEVTRAQYEFLNTLSVKSKEVAESYTPIIEVRVVRDGIDTGAD